MASTKAGLNSVNVRVDVYEYSPSPEQVKERPFDYLGRVQVNLRDLEGTSLGVRTSYYTVKFNKVKVTRLERSIERHELFAGIRQQVANLLSEPPANFTLKSNGQAWVEDELWAVAHEWEQDHAWLLYCPMELTYLCDADRNVFSGRESAVWLTYDEAAAKRSELLAASPNEIFDIVYRTDHMPTNYS